MVSFRELKDEEFEKIPSPKPPKPPNQWDEVLGVLESGKAVDLEVPENKLRGTRIGLARAASSRGMKLEFRPHDDQLAVRSVGPMPPKEPKERKPRTKKTAEE
jgi:hypothetical protein